MSLDYIYLCGVMIALTASSQSANVTQWLGVTISLRIIIIAKLYGENCQKLNQGL